MGHPLYGRVTPCQCNQPALDATCGLSADEQRIRLVNLRTEGREGARAMLAAAQDFLKTKTGFLSLCGTWGNGKTLVLQGLVNACIEQGIEARYITAAEMMLWLQEAFDPKVMETNQARINQLARVPVLCMDELEKYNTPYADKMQNHIINLRYREARHLGTVFAWNGNLAALPWPAVRSRMSEFIVVENKDADLRPMMGQAKARKAGAG